MTSSESSRETGSPQPPKTNPQEATSIASTPRSDDVLSSSSACPDANQMSLSGLSPWHERGICHPWFDRGVDSPEIRARRKPPLVHTPGTRLATKPQEHDSDEEPLSEASDGSDAAQEEDAASEEMASRLSEQLGQETWEDAADCLGPEIEGTDTDWNGAALLDMQSQEQLEAELHSSWY
jgi:hypothetical protein